MLGGGDDDVSVIYVVYPCGKVSVSSLGSFSSVGSSSKPSHPSFPLSLSDYTILKSILRRRGEESNIHQATGREGKARGAEEANECDSPSEVCCWLLGVGPHGIRS